VLKVGAFPVASDGTILYEGNRISAAFAFQGAQSGENVSLQIWRDGQAKEASLPVYVYTKDRNAGYQYGVLPRYFVHGGLVFTPLSFDYLRSRGGHPSDPQNADLYYELFYRPQEAPSSARKEPVLLASVLADAVNANMSQHGRGLVDKINGVRIDKLEDVVRAFETTANAYDVIEFSPNHTFECLDRSEVTKANDRILETYGVEKDRRL